MKWKISPIIKIYEALGSIADKRIETNGNISKVYSSSRGKFYTITFDPDKNAIMANDNGSYWVGYLGYPSIAHLMVTGHLDFDERFAEALKNIQWKDINQQFKNDFSKTKKFVDELVVERGYNLCDFHNHINDVLEEIKLMDLSYLGGRVLPPKGY